MITQETIKIDRLLLNAGQVAGLPKNPRFIRDERYKALVKSIKDAPEMLHLRELLVYQHGDKYVVIGGNMRLRACKELGMDSVPCKILPQDTPVEKLREYVIKDNNGFGQDDWDLLANEWEAEELAEWGLEIPTDWGATGEETDEQEYQRKKKEFEERMAAGELSEDDEEYQEFLAKFEAKKTTDDCYTPEPVYEAVADWVANEYNLKRKDFERPFYPGGDYKKHIYPDGCVVVDNPPFSILAEILTWYKEHGVRFFLFAPGLTLFSSSSSSSSTAIALNVSITYANGANVSTSFLTNLEPPTLRLKSEPRLYRLLEAANKEYVKSLGRKEFPNYHYPDEVVTASAVGYLSKYGQDFEVRVDESEPISVLDSQRESGKAIFGKGYLISKQAAAREAAAREAAAREAAAREAAAHVWELSEREKGIVKKLTTQEHGKKGH